MDNVSSETSVEELSRFVSSLKVKVVSCFEVKNRLSEWQRRTDDACSGDHKTFRLCIAKADSSKLLQSNAWPSGIIIAPLFRAKPNEQNVIDRPGWTAAEIIGRSSNTLIDVEQYVSVAKENSKGNTQSDDELNSAADALTSDINRFVAIAMNNVDDTIGVASVVREEKHGNETAGMEVVTEDNNSNTSRD